MLMTVFTIMIITGLSFKVELLGPLIKCSIRTVDNDKIHSPLLNMLLSLLKKFLYCQCNQGNQKKVK